MKKNVHDGHRERMRQRFMKEGADSFEDHELLELLLFYAIPRRNTNEIAHLLLDKYGSLDSLFDAPIEDIANTHGVGESTALFLKLIPAIHRGVMKAKAMPKSKIFNAEQAIEILTAQYIGFQEEAVTLISLDNRNCVKDISIVSYGTLKDVLVDIRKIVLTLVKHNATNAIIAHNHPQGVAKPSVEDVNVTRELRTALASLDIRLLDHIIIADNEHYSMASSDDFKWIFGKNN